MRRILVFCFWEGLCQWMVQTTFNYNKSISYMIFLASSRGQLPPLAPPWLCPWILGLLAYLIASQAFRISFSLHRERPQMTGMYPLASTTLPTSLAMVFMASKSSLEAAGKLASMMSTPSLASLMRMMRFFIWIINEILLIGNTNQRDHKKLAVGSCNIHLDNKLSTW